MNRVAEMTTPTHRLTIATMPPADRRDRAGVRLVHILLPGAGLIGQNRVGLGLVLGLATWLPLTAAAFATWIEPAALPAGVVTGLAGVAGLAYLAGQVLLIQMLNTRARRQADYLARTIPPLESAYEAMAGGKNLQAQLHLDELLAFDREHFEGNLVQARLLAGQRKFDKAAVAYARCRRLDPAGRWKWEIERELAMLPPG